MSRREPLNAQPSPVDAFCPVSYRHLDVYKRQDQVDTMYMWSDLFTYGKDAVLPGYTFSTRRVEQRDAGEKPTL